MARMTPSPKRSPALRPGEANLRVAPGWFGEGKCRTCGVCVWNGAVSLIWSKERQKVSDRAHHSGPNIVPDPERAPLIRKAFELMASGLYRTNAVLKIVT